MSSLAERIERARPLRQTRAWTSARLAAWNAALRSNALWIAVVAALLAFQFLLIFTHDPWLDEYQALQIAVEAPDLATMAQWLAYEGHPPLWYLLLRGLAYLTDPLWTLPVAAALCAIAMQGAVLFASPFNRIERLLIAASQFVMFEYLTISRSLSLGGAAMFAAMALWRSRAVWIAIAILPMCDFLFGVVSVGLAAIKLRERDLWWPGVMLWTVSGVLAAWSVIPAADAEPAIASGSMLVELGFWASTMGNLLLPWQGMTIPQWNDYPFFLIVSWGWVAFIWLAWRLTNHDRLYRFLVIGLIALTFVFSLTVYRLSARHLMVIALMLILVTWRLRAAGEAPRAGFRLWIAIAAACGLLTGLLNLAWPFDRAPQVAQRIEQLGLQNEHWVVFPVSRAQGVSAHSGIDFERTEKRCLQSFVRWDHHSKLTTRRRMIRYLRREIAEHGRGYLLSDIRFSNFPADLLQPIEFIPRGYGGQPFYLYVIGPNAPERRVSLPPCVPGRRPFARLG